MREQPKLGETSLYIISILAVIFVANCRLVLETNPRLTGAVLWIAAAVILMCIMRYSAPKGKIRACSRGVEWLKVFLWSTAASVIYHTAAAFFLIPGQWKTWVWSAVICICVEAAVFWGGMIRVYIYSVQLGIRYRIMGALCGMIPIVNLFVLRVIIRVVSDETAFETEKVKLNEERKGARICRTKYPILLVHGVFFRDYKYVNYWGRIPGELEKNGAQIFYGNHESAASVSGAAEELTKRIREIVAETGCGKVNIIAHSKGGLDCRYAISNCGAGELTASLTTINTPHRGCEFADYLLNNIPVGAQEKLAGAYNAAMKKLGDSNPDFMAAVYDLSAGGCRRLSPVLESGDITGIYCQSVGSRLNRALSGKFPLNFTYHLVKYFDGPNDGLVSEKSFRWGENYMLLTTEGSRGISHGDIIDLNRENIPGFDVREFYVQLVAELKEKGL